MATRPPRHNANAQVDHRLEQQRQADKSKRYDVDWRRIRAHFLAENPLCALCHAEGKIAAAEVVHHIVDIAVDPSRRLDVSNFQQLCKRHHDGLTARATHEKRRFTAK